MIITMPVPPSTNALYRNVKGVGRVKTKAYKSWLTAAAWCLKGHDRLPGPVELFITAPHNGRRDLDNYAKPVIDAISKGEGRVIDGDRCATVRHINLTWAAKDSAQSKAKLLTVEVVPVAFGV